MVRNPGLGSEEGSSGEISEESQDLRVGKVLISPSVTEDIIEKKEIMEKVMTVAQESVGNKRKMEEVTSDDTAKEDVASDSTAYPSDSSSGRDNTSQDIFGEASFSPQLHISEDEMTLFLKSQGVIPDVVTESDNEARGSINRGEKKHTGKPVNTVVKQPSCDENEDDRKTMPKLEKVKERMEEAEKELLELGPEIRRLKVIYLSVYL